MNDATVTRSCSRCGRPIAPDAPEGLCVSCLFAAGTETLTSTRHGDETMASVDSAHHAEPLRFEPGDTYGPYRLGKLLGRGGMGEVYEAEQLETGRRVALKLLRSRLYDAADRARFLREGQLAASVSHPHTVYIFGSEEIAGMPAISMELLPGGTLKDRVTTGGPMPWSEAVTAVLEIIGGLDAAQAAGILHRDIKPSNIFTDATGGIKVGDFGLSISTLARGLVREGEGEGFQGTPQFAPPEQLRGEPLDVRADIYAVGATLYYLLTGQPPFEAADLRSLFDRVINEPPVSPRMLRHDIPAGLAAIVLQCLAKTAAERPASYAALGELLRPFASMEHKAATPGIRFVAGLVDSMLLSALFMLWSVSTLDVLVRSASDTVARSPWLYVVTFAYYQLLEGFGGASLGKRLFGLRVSAAESDARTSWAAHRASWMSIAIRTAAFMVPGLLLRLVISLEIVSNVPPGPVRQLVESAVSLLLVASLFLTARRRNGWAGLHDLLSGTRVVSRASDVRRVRDTAVVAHAVAGKTLAPGRRFGPFSVVADAGSSADGHVFVAFDPVLQRQVWIHEVPRATPPVPDARRDASRTGRLHWLTGRRSDDENWDAYEGCEGAPFVSCAAAGVPWVTLRVWLLDLVTELTASLHEVSLPVLGIERLWCRDDGHLVLLDFPAPGTEGRPASQTNASPAGLVAAVIRTAKESSGAASAVAPIPLGARAFLDRWSTSAPDDLAEARTTIERLAASPDVVTPRRRATPIGLSAVPVIGMLGTGVISVVLIVNMMGNSTSGEMLTWLQALREPRPDSRLHDPAIREAAEKYMAGRFGAVLTESNTSESVPSGAFRDMLVLGKSIVARHPSVSPEEMTRLATVLAPEIQRVQEQVARSSPSVAGVAGPVVTALVGLGVFFAMGCGLVSSLISPGGLVTRLSGLAVVGPTGHEIGRGRSLARMLVAWLPAFAWLLWLASAPRIQVYVPNPSAPFTGLALMLGALAIGAGLTLARPSRGPHDRLMGTTVVPR